MSNSSTNNNTHDETTQRARRLTILSYSCLATSIAEAGVAFLGPVAGLAHQDVTVIVNGLFVATIAQAVPVLIARISQTRRAPA